MTSMDIAGALKGKVLEAIGKHHNAEADAIQRDIGLLHEVIEQVDKQIKQGLNATSINGFVDAFTTVIDRIARATVAAPAEKKSSLPKIPQKTRDRILNVIGLFENSAFFRENKVNKPRLQWIKDRLGDPGIIQGERIAWGADETNSSQKLSILVDMMLESGVDNANSNQLVQVVRTMKIHLVAIYGDQIREQEVGAPITPLRKGQQKRILQLCDLITRKGLQIGLGAAADDLQFIRNIVTKGDIVVGEEEVGAPEKNEPQEEKKVIAQLERIINMATKERVTALTTEYLLRLHNNLQSIIDTLIAAQSQPGSVGISSDTAKNLVALCDWIDKRAIDLESKDEKLDLTAVRTTMNKISRRYIGKEIRVIGDIREGLSQEVSALTVLLRGIDIKKIPQMDVTELRQISGLLNGTISDLLVYQEQRGGAPIPTDVAVLLQRVCTALADRATALATSENIDTSNQKGFFMAVISILGTRIKVETTSAPANEAGVRSPSERLLALLDKNKPEAVSGYHEDQIETLAQEISKIVSEFTQQDIQMTIGVRFDLLELLDALDDVCTGAMVNEAQRRRMENVQASIRKNKNALVDGTVKMKREGTTPSRVASPPTQSAGRELPEWLRQP